MTDEERSSERRAAEAKLAEERYQRAIAEENAEEAERTRKLAAFDGLLEALKPFSAYAEARLKVFGPCSLNSYLEPSVNHLSGKERIEARITREHWDEAIAAIAAAKETA